MAVVDPKANKTRSDAEEAGKKTASSAERDGGRVVDLFTEKNLPVGERVKLDKDEDAWTFSAPPPAGRYSLKVMPAKDFVKLKNIDPEDNTKGIYYSLALECKVLDKDLTTQLATVFSYVNTRIGRGKNISTAAGLIGKLGYKIPDEADDYSVAKLCAQAIKAEKIAEVELDWQGQYKDDKGEYKNAWKSMQDFPRDAEGNPMHLARFRDSKGNEYDVSARLEVKHWYKKGEASITPKVATGAAGTGSNGPVPIKAGNLIPIESEPVLLAQAAQGSQAQGDADMLTLLEE